MVDKKYSNLKQQLYLVGDMVYRGISRGFVSTFKDIR